MEETFIAAADPFAGLTIGLLGAKLPKPPAGFSVCAITDHQIAAARLEEVERRILAIEARLTAGVL
jgi:hypothetical protein